MNKLSHKILDRIKEQKVTPKSRAYFICLNSLLILAIVFSIIVGSFAVAIIIRHFSLTDWELAHQFSGGTLKAFFILLPYLWVVFILLAIFFADQLFRHTKTGHRRKSWVILLGSILLSLNFGYILYLTKIDQPFENVLISNIPLYESLEREKDRLFAAPDMGVLAGQIVAINSDKEWVLLDFNNKKWLIYVDGARLKENLLPTKGTHVGIIGEPIDSNRFRAEIITLWKRQIFVAPSPMVELKIRNLE